MAKRVPITIDAEVKEVDPQTVLSHLVPADARSVVSYSGKIIPASEFGRYRAADVPDGFDTQTATINKAAAVWRDTGLKARETALVNHWLSGFEPCAAGPRNAFLSSSHEFLAVRNFPLPDNYRPDHINLCIAIDRYPTVPPLGIYLADTRLTPKIVERMRAQINVFKGSAFHDAEPPRPGFQWVCLIASDWRVNWADIRKGSNLQKYLAHFYAVLAD